MEDNLNDEAERVSSRYTMKNLIVSQNARKRSIYNNEGLHPEYTLEFNFLNLNIGIIEDMIVMCLSPYEICRKLSIAWKGISGQERFRELVLLCWYEDTKYLDRITRAVRLSADVEISMGKDFMMHWLNNPKLGMQHVGLVREVGLYYAKMAEFKNRGKYGKRINVEDDRSSKNNIIITKDSISDFLHGLDNKEKKAEELRNEDNIKINKKDNEDDFISYEELKD